MIFNELLTNALKYGALSQPEGRVRITWTFDDDLKLTWNESGGPTPSPNRKSGFGSLMVQQNVLSIGGNVTMDWKPDGLVVSLTCPRSALNDEGGHP
jgi:two-component sensor histidine kinase